ncbi:MAG: adenosylcobinamide-phosphate synthase CbiB [Rhodoferax sp.]|nr:adenosylcobinamide-phosphate synthase CbiB [Rhodoferax sp.]MDP3652915.1 adenosylcobinamide-phosphate synthase CbiB [Rhodoferax sp.]
MPAWGLGVAVLVALGVDRRWGEPPVRLHPVVWMGHYLGWAGKRVQQGARQDPGGAPDYKAFWLGALAWCAGAALVLIAAVVLQQVLVQALAVAGPAGWEHMGATLLAAVLLGALLKPLLAWTLLKNEVLAVEKALAPEQGGSLAAGRERLRWLVSRDVSQLTEAQVRESAIETLAENLNDSVVAPLFWFALLGLPGAALFRLANTADAMWGYRGLYQGRNWEWAGKWAARADDILGWLPARLTALLLVLAAGGVSLVQLKTEAQRTASPNSGWPMAAMALGLGVCLHKPGVYALNAPGRAPGPQDTQRAIAYASNGLLALVGIAQAAIILIAIGELV